MAVCRFAPIGTPVIQLTLVGSGEPLLRMEKRLHCAATGAGMALELSVCRDAEMLGIPMQQTPAVLLAGRVVLTGLQRTEAIEAWLRETFHTDKQ
ncbi:MAG: thioredoxin family protein [Thiobacillus sp. 63-78]|nr:thioredoxin family protein [Thiobacillus sp.]ODU14325.1 MAG: hypothetical protein ABS91_00395 [Thiobacillus sp. SCN 64-35]OJZ08680.1 MAG: thioredoxin family protein [Thiobacillus sp. 63-78]